MLLTQSMHNPLNEWHKSHTSGAIGGTIQSQDSQLVNVLRNKCVPLLCHKRWPQISDIALALALLCSKSLSLHQSHCCFSSFIQIRIFLIFSFISLNLLWLCTQSDGRSSVWAVLAFQCWTELKNRRMCWLGCVPTTSEHWHNPMSLCKRRLG